MGSISWLSIAIFIYGTSISTEAFSHLDRALSIFAHHADKFHPQSTEPNPSSASFNNGNNHNGNSRPINTGNIQTWYNTRNSPLPPKPSYDQSEISNVGKIPIDDNISDRPIAMNPNNDVNIYNRYNDPNEQKQVQFSSENPQQVNGINKDRNGGNKTDQGNTADKENQPSPTGGQFWFQAQPVVPDN